MADAEVARLANGAEPAGEADPYRQPREIDDELDDED
jgi:ribosome-binding factor A